MFEWHDSVMDQQFGTKGVSFWLNLSLSDSFNNFGKQ